MDGVFDWLKRRAAEAGRFIERVFPKTYRTTAPAPPPVVNYYEVLGVSPGATVEEIRAAYRKLAKEWHPDVRPGDPEAAARFALISEAHTVLTDPEKRTAYDRSLAIAAAVAAAAARPLMPSPFAPQVPPSPPFGAMVVRPEAPPAVPVVPMAPKFPATPEEKGPPVRGAIPLETLRAFGMLEEIPFPPPMAVPAPPPSVPSPPSPAPFFPQVPPAPPAPPVPTAYPSPHVTPPPYPAEIQQNIAHMDRILVNTWPLEEIFATVRQNRRHPEFLRTNLMIVMPVAGHDPQEALEYELGDRLGVPRFMVLKYAKSGELTTTLWTQVFLPLFEAVTLAFDRIKPADIPGRFTLMIDPTRTRVDLVYSE
jgi:hypothetical protein